MRRVALVGAGVAGLGAAYALRESGAAVTLFEKSRGVGGRAATRRRHRCVYDHGANYIKPADSPAEPLVRETLWDAGLIEIPQPVWTFDAAGEIGPGDDRDRLKLSYQQGITRLAKRLHAASGATLRTQTRVTAIRREATGWHLADKAGRRLGEWDALLLTPPAPQSADLAAAMAWDSPLRARVEAAARAVPYRTVLSLVLHYPFPLDRPWYALINVDRQHAIGWLSREECKAGHVPPGEALLIVQMAPDWSTAHLDAPRSETVARVAALAADLLDDPRLRDPDWSDMQRWRYALPDAAADPAPLDAAEAHGLFFAGDWRIGKGRVHRALINGLETGKRIRDWLT